ncbi:MAG: hypothetical protein OEY91_05165 [Nitrospirota bacterium]|nr:hypothetical protein [Nitrospirota bacterium]
MLSLTAPMLTIETVNWQALLPTYPYRFYGSGYLYCVRCQHYIRLVSVSNKEVCCSDCTKVLANSMNHRYQKKGTE